MLYSLDTHAPYASSIDQKHCIHVCWPLKIREKKTRSKEEKKTGSERDIELELTELILFLSSLLMLKSIEMASPYHSSMSNI